MWWNFIGRTHEDIVRARADWQHLLEAGDSPALVDAGVVAGAAGAPRFGPVVQLPAGYPLNGDLPVIPATTLKPRGDKTPPHPGADENLDTGQTF